MTVLRLGVSGLGRGAVLTLPALAAHPSIHVAAAYDPSPEARRGFQSVYGGILYDEFEALCGDPSLDWLYIASPHHFHAAQSIAASAAGKNVLVEKPMAVRLDEAAEMLASARRAGTRLLIGPSHGFDPPVALAAELIASGRHGRVRMIQALHYSDFLYRPRRAEELDTSLGGGVVHSQATHQIDIVRRLANAPVRSVRAQAGGWDPERGSEGAYSALLQFDGGAWASLSYSGYGRWDSDVLSGWIGELGTPSRPGLRSPLAADELKAKQERGFAGAPGRADSSLPSSPPSHHEHFGFVLVSCEGADLEITPNGVSVYRHGGREDLPVSPPPAQRYAVAEALVASAAAGENVVFDGQWGLETLACCHAILRSSQEGRDVSPSGLLSSLEKPS